jgi:hypothetical protein
MENIHHKSKPPPAQALFNAPSAYNIKINKNIFIAKQHAQLRPERTSKTQMYLLQESRHV